MTTWIDTGARKEDILRETPKALQVVIHARRARDGSRAVWLPKSQVTWVGNDFGFTDTIHIPGWLARQLTWGS